MRSGVELSGAKRSKIGAKKARLEVNEVFAACAYHSEAFLLLRDHIFFWRTFGHELELLDLKRIGPESARCFFDSNRSYKERLGASMTSVNFKSSLKEYGTIHHRTLHRYSMH